MKSAYELAMERLSKSAPTKKLSAAQKERIAELESLYKSKIAQEELSTNDEIAAAEGGGDFAKAEQLRERLVGERHRLQAELEAKKERVRTE